MGPRLWERLRGMFAVAVWDARERRLVLARDRFGIKPLAYRDVDGELSFSSELDALPHGEVDLDALEAFLTFNVVPAPLSIFKDIRKLLPGHTLTWHDGRTSFDCFARTGPLPTRHDEDEAELVEECRARLRDSVRAHLIADVPVGVLLSGGVDSGALTALAAEESSEAVRTFSIGFTEASFDELDGARAVARRYGTVHRDLTLRPDAALLLPALADAFDEPFADSSALPTYLVSKLAAEDVKVALSGEGSDELFGGYYTYVADLLAERFGPLAARARPAVDRLPSSTRKASLDYRLKRFTRAAGMPPLERHHAYKEIFAPDVRAELTGRRSSYDPLVGYRARFAGTEGHELLTRLQDVDFGLYLVDDLLTKTDRASMAWSLEARVPFMDTVVSNFAFSLPVRHKVRGFSKKRLLRKAMEPLLPHEIVHGKKRGFSIPAAAWLRGELEPFARETLSADDPATAGLPAAGGGDARDRRPCLRPRGSLPPAVGAARIHALARTARRGHHARRLARERDRMKVWIDFTASAHPLVFRPLVQLLEAQGNEVEITAREYAQTLQLIESHGMTATVIGHHGGRSALGKAAQMRTRLKALRRFAKGRNFDLALAHGSHELTMTARRLGIPSSTTFDYEWAWLQHQLGCRAATRVVVPAAIPPERLKTYGAVPPKLQQYPGLKEEYYLSDFEPDESVLDRLVDRPGPRARRAAAAARRLALPPALESALPDDARASRPVRRRARVRHPAHRGTARLREVAGAPVGDRPRRGRRCAEPDRARRPGRVGRRNDEPRSSGARRAGVHDLRRPARRRRRAADPRRTAPPAHRPARARAAEARSRDRNARAPRPAADARSAAVGTALSQGRTSSSTSGP